MRISNGASRSGTRVTPLKKGDKCMLNKRHGTVAFTRNNDPLFNDSGDDKFLLHLSDLVQFNEVMKMVAGAARLKAVFESDKSGYVTYRFE